MTLCAGLSLKDHLRLERLTRNLVFRYYPDGKQQIESEANELMKMFQFKYSQEQVMDVLSYATCCCYLAQYISVEDNDIISTIRTRISGTSLSMKPVRCTVTYRNVRLNRYPLASVIVRFSPC